MKNMCRILFVIVLTFMVVSCASGSKSGTEDSASVSENIKSNDGINEEEIREYVKDVWFKLPPIVDRSIEGSSKYLTEQFNSILTKAYSKFVKISAVSPEDGMDLAEWIYGWWGAQEPDLNGELKIVSVVPVSETEAKVFVNYKNWSNIEAHTVYLKKENGEWRIDNFDDIKAHLEMEL